jgi:transcriptional regulator with XRE-family HTH domain
VGISPQYLNDIEHDRRNPTSDHMIGQFEQVLGTDEGYLFVRAGKIPDDMMRAARDPAKIGAAFRAFRKELSKR